MKIMRHVRCLSVGLCLAATTSAVSFAQHVSPDEILGGPLVGHLLPFLNAPFSAEAITTVNHQLPNRTRLERTASARYYRDSKGRVRVEQLMEGLPAPKTVSERHIRLLILVNDRERHWPYRDLFTVDPTTRTARDGLWEPDSLSAGGGSSAGVPIGGVRYVNFKRAQDWLRHGLPAGVGDDAVQYESLGARLIAGVETTGQRITLTFPPGYVAGDNEERVLVDEQWVSRELRLIIAAHYSDSRTGTTDYWLTNLRRDEPSSELFIIPYDYTLLDPKSAGATEDPWSINSTPERYVVDLAAGRVKR
jgi:hypothetical protein